MQLHTDGTDKIDIILLVIFRQKYGHNKEVFTWLEEEKIYIKGKTVAGKAGILKVKILMEKRHMVMCIPKLITKLNKNL